jgi:phosphoribosylformimino-5-aminoimidazole carboxamide ribotide isomerase
VLIPCIDLQRGRAVQLVHGRKRELEVTDVFSLLDKFKKYQWLHIIDLDAAMGKQPNRALVHSLIERARNNHGFKVRVGGGIRTIGRARELMRLGADQIIVGSAALRDGKVNTRFLRRLAKEAGRKHIVIALDTARGFITIHGWRERVSLRAAEIMPQLETFCGGFLCTDVDREGTMTGVNLSWFRELRGATSVPIIASGGISSRRQIDALENIGMDAAVGMAVYKNRLS